MTEQEYLMVLRRIHRQQGVAIGLQIAGTLSLATAAVAMIWGYPGWFVVFAILAAILYLAGNEWRLALWRRFLQARQERGE